MNLSEKDLNQLKAKGITEEMLESQLRSHHDGFPFLDIKDAANPSDGTIKVLTAGQEAQAAERWQRFLDDGGDVYKFVPASGAASRMFKALFNFAQGSEMTAPEGSDPRALIDNYTSLPFLPELRDAVERLYSAPLEKLIEEGRHRDIITAIIAPEGMNYGNLPKGLLKFHSYPEGSRTPLQEHLTEGAQTAANASGIVNLHFTVSADHKKLFEESLSRAIPEAEQRTGRRFNVSLSLQKPSTDTIAANPDGTPFRDPDHDDALLFRPGGHGALIQNLNDIDSTVVFIKNIDNVVPDSRRADTIRYKTVLAGYLILVHDRIASLAERLSVPGEPAADLLAEAVAFLRDELCITAPQLDELHGRELADWILAKLNRPLRVCGMVRNEGEPGGGPFIARNPDGSYSPQILESTQIDMSRPESADMLSHATHFNPVDLVCYLRDTAGQPFDLPRYVDPATGFISSKSAHGRELRALELPGLWNGAMSDWNTVFVEVPVSTFNPVKTVNDLLRPAHRSAE